jgi:hypothetical protein
MYGQSGINHAANLPAVQNDDISRIFNQRIASYVIQTLHYSLPLNLILDIDSDVDLCNTINYLCQSDDNIPEFAGTALNAGGKRQTLSPPKIIQFNGFCIERMEVKLNTVQITCINQNPILRAWYNSQLQTAIDRGRETIMRKFYRELLNKAHSKNSGNMAGMQHMNQVVGTLAAPVLFDANNADKWFTSVLEVVKQMPKLGGDFAGSEFGHSSENAFIFGPPGMEQVLMQTDQYNSYDKVGDCAACSLFRDTFVHKPRGIMPITSHCIESYDCVTADATYTVYSVLFGKRNIGAKASIRVETDNYMTEDKESMIYKTLIYHHMHVYDCRFFGKGAITIQADQPETIEGCGA